VDVSIPEESTTVREFEGGHGSTKNISSSRPSGGDLAGRGDGIAVDKPRCSRTYRTTLGFSIKAISFDRRRL